MRSLCKVSTAYQQGIHIQTKSKASDKGGPERPPLTRALLSAMPSPRRVGMRHPWRLLPS
ncbi:hypothetical protein EYZ02_04360 [Hafnia alvei]|nr:hypothetical protein EYZ02_04360 [Hafnia alvei]TBM08320.1 hypothetical protein EYY84_20875 [Hafnia alvei]